MLLELGLIFSSRWPAAPLFGLSFLNCFLSPISQDVKRFLCQPVSWWLMCCSRQKPSSWLKKKRFKACTFLFKVACLEYMLVFWKGFGSHELGILQPFRSRWLWSKKFQTRLFCTNLCRVWNQRGEVRWCSWEEPCFFLPMTRETSPEELLRVSAASWALLRE